RETHQVHGAAVLYVDAGSTAAETRAVEADALLTRHEGLALGVRTADCVPLLLADVRTGAVAALHAGWRGLVAGIVPAALRAFATLCGNRPSEWIAAIGPHIRADAFEVADDVAGRIVAAVGEARALVRRPGRPHVDLAIAVRAQLLAAGMRSERIDDVGGCTFAESTRFFSYRRDGTRSGRHLSVIVARAADRNAS
ncbi:MAG: peptidoglycan editing factor PgeF, partial [Myxococcota bacterium]|nr:peptidoglycan editing factor PgeF [Myxococcota bacterium]